LEKCITNYYKNLLGESALYLDESQIGDIAQVHLRGGECGLNSPFKEDEAKQAIIQMKHNKSPGQMTETIEQTNRSLYSTCMPPP
jgi:hypothetical protein